MKMIRTAALASFLLAEGAAQRLKRIERPGIRHLSNHFYDNEEQVYGSDRFISYFEIEYATLYDSTDDLEEAARSLISAYNDLIVKYDDPFERRMVDVRVLSPSTGRRLTSPPPTP